MKQKEKPVQGILLDEKEPDEVNGGLRMQNETIRTGIPVEDEALEDVSGGLRVQST